MRSLMLTVVLGLLSKMAMAATLTIYTDRPTARLQPVVDQFKAQFGVAVTIVELPYKDILSRLKLEGANSPADVLFTKDLVFQTELARLGFYQSMNSKSVANLVAAPMRDPQMLWTAITYRVRSLVYDPTRTDVSSVQDYSDLAKPEWVGKLCLRSSQNSYNEALVASWIGQFGYSFAKNLVSGLVQNLAMDSYKGDTALIEAIANGDCEIGLANHYYLAQLHATKPNFPIAIKFLGQQTQGVHINGSGAGIAATSQQPQLAQQFIELLLTDKNQIEISTGHFEYPAVQHLLPTTLIRNWGPFKADQTNWTVIGQSVEDARQLVKEVEYK